MAKSFQEILDCFHCLNNAVIVVSCLLNIDQVLFVSFMISFLGSHNYNGSISRISA